MFFLATHLRHLALEKARQIALEVTVIDPSSSNFFRRQVAKESSDDILANMIDLSATRLEKLEFPLPSPEISTKYVDNFGLRLSDNNDQKHLLLHNIDFSRF